MRKRISCSFDTNVHITVRLCRIVIKENKTSVEKRSGAHKSTKAVKRNLLLSRALKFSRTSWFNWSRERVLGGIVGERAIEISQGKKAELEHFFISQKRRAFAVEFSHPGVYYEEETLGFRNPS